MCCDNPEGRNLIIRGKWETTIENGSIPLFLLEMGVGVKFGSGQRFAIEPIEPGGFRVVPIGGLMTPTGDRKRDLVEMDEERRTIPAPRALLAALSEHASKEVILVGMLDTFEIYPRAVWDRVEREEMQNMEGP